ncbi:MAG: M67 family peptidase [Anaerolineales bacterium]|nr:MAG: M67 family peptidase [Anaerolineales bacterium]
MALHLTNGQTEEMIRHARREYPDEACGLLAGKACPEQGRRDGRVEKVYPMTNAEHSPVTYRLDPEEQYHAFMEIEEEGRELLAIYHSHSHSPAYPSATDLELAFYPDSLYIIISLADRARPTIRAFRIVEGVIEEERVEITLFEEA